MPRGVSVKRKRKARPRKPKPRLSEATAMIAWGRTEGFCACGCGRRAESWHHCWPQNKWPDLVDVADNIVAVADYCHGRHTAAFQRFPRSICVHAEHLATTGPMKAYLNRTYV
jgi:hypothetical protein